MVQHNLGIRHFHRHRKPHFKGWKRVLDRGMAKIALLGPMVALPQVFHVWTTRDASNLSPITWFTWLVLAFVWLAYGGLHKERPIVAVNIGWIIINTSIVVGIILYG